ncbi:MAG TPA: hypothetical protein VK464_12695 [Symbiobacteriaceae bacterium]|jgi:hypothetical protein|nr:hypothetical protein [Symbiobacteriaceae bacterium]
MQDANMEARMVRAAAEAGDYERAVTIAGHLVPEMAAQLGQYQVQMALYEQARAEGNWRLAIRALADARLAAIAAGLPELEGVATDRLYTVVKAHELRRA